MKIKGGDLQLKRSILSDLKLHVNDSLKKSSNKAAPANTLTVARGDFDTKIAAASTELGEDAAYEAGDRFIRCLKQAIDDHTGDKHVLGQIGEDIADRLKELDYVVRKTGRGSEYAVYVFHLEDMDRMSLYPQGYPDGISDIVQYLNVGTSGESDGYVIGFWNNNLVMGLTSRDGARFIEQAIDDFNGNYAHDLGVKSVNVSYDY